MDPQDHHTRLVGDYLLGPKIGSGSFAVVWRSRHRNSGEVFAVKEIDKKQLSPKVSENLVKEISILSTIDHPNIIRLFEVIESKDRIFLVLEYCEGGDLSAYIHRHGRVSESVARRFMTQLAEGLQVLQEKHLIHRDLKPQNLLLSGSEETTLLKIGDFGFARSLTPQGLADTLCGSPLYMAPEIIQNQKYDAKADLWSVGAILFQLVTGKPPFDGNSQLQLFQNILASTELRFPQGTLKELDPDCVDLCRSLLRQNPVERLTFKEFFSHKFLREPRLTVDVEKSTRLPQLTARFDSLGFERMPQLHSGPPVVISSASSNLKSSSSMHDKIISHRTDHDCTSSGKIGHGVIPNTACEKLKRPTSAEICSSNHLKVSDSMESIEKEYVLVNAHITSMGKFSYYTESSLQENIATRVSISTQEKNDRAIAVGMQSKEQAACSVDGTKNPQSHGSDPSSILCTSTILREVQGLSILHPSTKLQLVHQYVCALAELDQEKYNAGLFLESFSVELVVLAVWKKALQVCSSWRSMTVEGDMPGSNAAANEFTFMQDNAGLYPYPSANIDFSSLKSVSEWAEQGFILAFDRAEKLSDYLRHTDGAAEMPDAMEMIFQKALGIGTSGAVDEYMENKGRAAVSYSKAMLLLTFIVGEATSLPLNPPFSLTPANKKRIENYIVNLHSHQAHFLNSKPSAKRSQDHFTK